MPTPHNSAVPMPGKGFGIAILLLVVLGVALTGYQYWSATRRPVPVTPPPPPPPPPAPALVNPQDALGMPDSKRRRVDLLVYDALMPPVQKTESGMIADFGKPLRIETATAGPDRLRTLVYSGMTMSFLHKTSTGGDLPKRMVVTSKSWVVKWYLGVGAKASLVLSTLGPPKARTVTTLTYSYSLATSTTTFTVANGVVTKVEWQYDTD